MAKNKKRNKNIQKAERESLNIKDGLLETLKSSTPEVFAEGKVNWDKLRRALGEHLETSADKFNFTWAGKAQAIANVLIPSKATLKPDKKESVKFDTSENLFIEGDNLEVLKLLQKSYFEQVKMIYIDPPYNTGNDFVYKDDFRQPLKNYLEQSGQMDSEGNRLSTNTQTSGRFHSDWLTMMYPRLKLAWNLLNDEGVIFISIDDGEVHHLRTMMDEIFGEENFVATLKWKKKKQPSYMSTHVATVIEYVLIYAKDKPCLEKLSIETRSDFNTRLDNAGNQISERLVRKGIRVKLRENIAVIKAGVYKIRSMEVEYLNDVKIENGRTLNDVKIKARFRNNQEQVNLFIDKDCLFITANHGLRRDLLPEEKEIRKSIKDLLLEWGDNQESDAEIKAIFPEGDIFNYPKPTKLIRNLTASVFSENEIILDFFAGSGTTAHAVLVQNQEDGGNRKFIMVQMPEPIDPKSEAYKAGYKTIADIAKERIRRVIKGYGDHKPIDDGFKIFKLGKSNYYDNLFEYDPERGDEENDKAFKDYLNKVHKELFPAKINEIDIVYENIIKEGLSLNAKIEEVKIGKSTVYKVSDTERELYISLDEKLSTSSIEALMDKEYKEKIFVCFDGALNDSDKANLALNLTLKTI